MKIFMSHTGLEHQFIIIQVQRSGSTQHDGQTL